MAPAAHGRYGSLCSAGAGADQLRPRRKNRRCRPCGGQRELARSCFFLLLSEDQCRVEFEDPAVAAHQSDVAAWRLACAALSADLDDRLAERRVSPHVVARQLASARVYSE